jgi:hypothetical protein
MHSGQRVARVVSSPFWMLSSSTGSPSLAHCTTSTSVVSNASRLSGDVNGMARLAASGTQLPCSIAWR